MPEFDDDVAFSPHGSSESAGRAGGAESPARRRLALARPVFGRARPRACHISGVLRFLAYGEAPN